ncbi:hypothetical protein ABEG18_13010 [Alsobacter sp. KACC 23698]|uniref:Uncharacterized protein n=1 Tax=Alsobacter sp. KACC 23698 TaxID=3149229 RepID=A0AAU7JNW2_9HYPH
MVIEELIAKLGFEVSNLDKLKGVSKAFEKVRDEVSKAGGPVRELARAATTAASSAMAVAAPMQAVAAAATLVGGAAAKAKSPLKGVGVEAKKTSTSVVALAAGSKVLSGAMTALSAVGRIAWAALRGFAIVLASLAGVAVSAAAALAIPVAMLAKMGASAASARREMQLLGKSMGTKAQSLDSLGTFFEKLTFEKGAEKAQEMVKALDELIKKSREGDEAAQKTLREAGIRKKDLTNRDGSPRDRSEIALQGVLEYEKRVKAATSAEKTASAAQAAADQAKARRDKNATALQRKANAAKAKVPELKERAGKTAEGLGVDGLDRARLDRAIAEGSLAKTFRDATSQRPTLSNAEEERRAKVGKMNDDLAFVIGSLKTGIGERLTELGVTIAEKVLPPLLSFAETLLAFAKRFGIIKQTKEEADSEAQGKIEANRQQQMLQQSKENDRLPNARRRLDELRAKPKTPATELNIQRLEELIQTLEQVQPAPEPTAQPERTPLPPERPDSLKPRPEPSAREPAVPKKPIIDGARPSENIEDRRGQSALPPKTIWERMRDGLGKWVGNGASASSEGAVSREPLDGAEIGRAAAQPIANSITEALGFLKELPAIQHEVKPETSASKIMKAAETKNETNNDNRKYEDIGNDHRTITNSVTVNASGLDEVAAKVKSAILGTITSKGANTSTGALTSP